MVLINREQTLDGTLVGLQVQPHSFGIIIWSWFLLQSLCLFSVILSAFVSCLVYLNKCKNLTFLRKAK